MATEKSPTPLHVLIVDDEPLIRWSMAETLAHIGHTVAEAGDAKQAMREVSDGVFPDVILLDFRLPDSNDLSLLEHIRHRVPSSAVVMMTAFGTPEVVAGALRLGAYRVVGKPVEMRELPALVEDAYRSRPGNRNGALH